MDQTKRPLLIPPEFATYAEQHGVFDMYKRMLEQVIVNKPENPIQFLIDMLKRDNNDVPQIVILGPPATGKRTIAKMVSSKLRTAHLTPDNLVTEAETDLKVQAQQFIKKNQTIPTELWMTIIGERMKLFDCVKKGWVMEGFPQTREQCLALQSAGIYPKHCVILEAPDTVLIERAQGKRVDPVNGDIYHTTFDWPSNPDIQGRLKEVEGYTEEDMINKLIVYHRHFDGIADCYKKCSKTINADQPKADVFSQVYTFLSGQSRSNAPHTPRIVLLGATGSGKGVQASLLANKYNIVNVSCGHLMKQAIVDETKQGQAAKAYIDKGMMVPDNIVMTILCNRLSQLDCVTRGWVLHGYPRSREQAETLTKDGFVPNRVFFLDVPNDSVMERLTLRQSDPITGERYHMMYNPPQTQEVKERLCQQPSDTEDAVRQRLAQYHTYVEEIADFYLDAQHVNADQDPHTVFECIESMVVNPLPKHFP
ncbi:KAD8-like protein [Mya arenaria]|uniref:KAD8-like protein n=1 Tax=Mya arenaria TaxID=6604 RepID=A0ABY7DZK3_MYAAR|nr:adenylate kinase 8-like [Mya arenaria]WAR01696.1 KAD8-like protein [Mya arenaria]